MAGTAAVGAIAGTTTVSARGSSLVGKFGPADVTAAGVEDLVVTVECAAEDEDVDEDVEDDMEECSRSSLRRSTVQGRKGRLALLLTLLLEPLRLTPLESCRRR